MRFEHEGMALWYGTPDTPAPEGAVRVGTDITVTIAVKPADASNKVELLYRRDQGTVETVTAKWLQHDLSHNAQYFKAHFPVFRVGDTVEYTAVCSCAGRQVPSPLEAEQLASSFHVVASETRLGASLTAEEVNRNFLGPATQQAVQQFQQQNGLPISGAVDEHTASAMNAATLALNTQNLPSTVSTSSAPVASQGANVAAPLSPGMVTPPALQRMPQQCIVTGNVFLSGVGRPLLEGTVQAFDRDLPSVERRGAAPQLLGESPLDANGRFKIAFTDEQFRKGEGVRKTLVLRKIGGKTGDIAADLSFHIFDKGGRELTITRVVAFDREYRPDQIIFNVPTESDVSIYVDTRQETASSEYEMLIALLAPIIEDIPLAELTEEDVVFLINELGVEQLLDDQNRIEWLRRSALLARLANLSIEAFYGWGRENVPAPFNAIARFNLSDLQSLLDKIISRPADDLRGALERAIRGNIIPAGVLDQIDKIFAQIQGLKINRGFLMTRRFVGKLVDERSDEPLVGFSVQGFDLDAGQEPKDLGQDVSNNQGLFALIFVTGRGKRINQAGRRLRLQVLINPQSGEKYETEVQAGGDQDILEVRVPIPAAEEPPTHQLTNLAATLHFNLPPNLLSFLAGKNIHTLADIRNAGDISQLEGLPVAADDPSIRLLEAHADLSRISPDVQINAAMITKHYDSVAAVAKASRPDFVTAMRDRIGDFKAAQLQVVAHAQTDFLNTMMFEMAADQANGFEAHPMMAERVRCSCQDCEAAVSPLAYLADLLKFATENIKNKGTLITAADLTASFHQPFDLPASCEATDTQIREVRLCVEVLRSYLGARPLADAAKEADLAKVEKEYRLAAYTSLLTKFGTSYLEVRLARTGEPALRESLADRLEIDLSHLNALFLDPDANPEVLTEARLEQLFGLVDTTRDPLALTTTSELQTWRLEYLRDIWKTQDFPTDSYEDGQNAFILKQLPAGIVFPPPLDSKVSYDSDRQQLVCKGSMTEDERTTLLTLSKNDAYQQAVKQLFQASQRLPIIDPDLIGPDDFRRPFLKANPTDPDAAFDLWKKRRDWVDNRLQAFAGLTKTLPGQTQPTPDVTAMLAAMYVSVNYGATTLVAWANTTPATEFETLYNQLTQGIDGDAIKFRLQDDLHLTVESFTRLMTIAAKAKAWESDTRSDKVQDEEWRELFSILIQAQKIKLFATWRHEESDAGIQLDPQTFWTSLRQPQEGDWPPISQQPFIDPDLLKLTDLPEPIVGERAITFWKARQDRLAQIPKDLAAERETNGFDAMLRLALGHPHPGNPLQYNLDTLKSDLSDPETVDSATTKITNDLHLTVDNFKRLLAIKAKNDDPKNQPTAAEWAELFAILTPARKFKHEYPVWVSEEQNPLTGVVYWNALKAKLPHWRASGESRLLWQQALHNRMQSPIIDPDLIGPGDLKNPAPGDPAFDLWKARGDAIANQLAKLQAEPKTLAGLDANFQSRLGVTVAEFLAIGDAQKQGNVISDRLAQLSLEVTEFNFLLRIASLATQTQPILDVEWENVYAILVQVWKRRIFARWRNAERAQNILLSSDFFQIPSPTPLAFSAKEPTVVELWRAPRAAFRDWQDTLQSRLDQEHTTIQGLAEGVSATEEATLPMLRDGLILATNAPGKDLEVKAQWITVNLLIDAEMSGCAMTTRAAQEIETLQGLITALRSGQLEDLYRTFELNLDYFDEKWTWLGSYAPWRAAMFVFLYPENILLPSLRKWQTPAFQTLVTNTRSSRALTPGNACDEATQYAQYLQDICTLRVEATCTSRTRLTRGDECNRADNGYRCLLYMFGRGGLTGKVYWSAHDFQDGSDYAQTIWTPIAGPDGVPIQDWDNIEDIIGAVPYQTTSNRRFIFLFARKRDASTRKETLICAKYDLENLTWQTELISLDVSTLLPNGFIAVVKQQDFEDVPPHIVISGQGAFELKFELKMSFDGNGWENQTPFPLERPGSRVFGMVRAGYDSFYLIRSLFGVLNCSLFVPVSDSRSGSPAADNARYKMVASHPFGETPLGGTQQLPTVGDYLGAFSWPGRDFIYIVTQPLRTLLTEGDPPWAFVWKVRDNGISNLLEVTLVNSPFGFSEPRIVPTSGMIEDATTKSKRFVYQADRETRFPSAIEDHFLQIANGDLYPREPRHVMPVFQGPFDIPGRLSTQDLQVRKGLIQKAYTDNRRPLSNLAYLEEAFEFVPIHLGLALQQSSEYSAALDWFRTVYDYTADESVRKIYYGLVVEESLADTYKRGQNWLLDPLNPHQIAATRRNTYTRFISLAIIRCLLDNADAEFSQDSAESNPRARRLYLIALKLLETKELKQSFHQCEDIIGVLDDVLAPGDPWQVHLQQIKGELKEIPDPLRLQPAVNQIRQALTSNEPLENRFVHAQAMLKQAKAALPPTPTLTRVIQENENFRQAVQRSAFSDSSLTGALESMSTVVTEDFQRTVAMVTGLSPARLEQKTVDLPWLREPLPLAVTPAEVAPGAIMAIARRDAAQVDILAPTSIATLAQIAALQPMNAVNLAMQAPAAHIPLLITAFCIPPNPLLNALRLRAELNLFKLRTCRNIAGLQRQLEPYVTSTDTTSGLPTVGAGGQLLLPGVVRLQPTLYRYPVLIERAKQLVQLAAQIEASMLAALEKRDIEAYNLLKARQDVQAAQAQVQLQDLRITQARDGLTLATLQQNRAQLQADTYQKWLDAGLNGFEKAMIKDYQQASEAQQQAVDLAIEAQYVQLLTTAAAGGATGGEAAAAAAAQYIFISGPLGDAQKAAITAQTEAQVDGVHASYERRADEWQLQENLAKVDVQIGAQEYQTAQDQVSVVTQEKAISQIGVDHAKAIVEFLNNKFTNKELYDWMSGVLEGVYRFFLQQATAMAQLAGNQLAFERQEIPPVTIKADYWVATTDGTGVSSTSDTSPDRRGLTGSARLLQDIYQLDQYAFTTNQRKLQLTKTISLARLDPFAFQQFRETGVLPFATSMERFDRDFPGHYLRLIKRVRTSVVALIPPIDGIHATLTTTGLSRVVIGPDIFQTVPIRRDPEFVALTSPSNATGLFELEPQSTDMLLPFEGSGVDTTGEFHMPKAANLFDYRTIADVLITYEYTALNSFDYRQQVIQTLNPNLSADRSFGFRDQFADQWYDLHNPEQAKTPMTVRFQTVREDFPPNIENLKIQQVLLYFARSSEQTFELPVTQLRFTAQGDTGIVGGSATPIDGVISTRRGNAGSWITMIGKVPAGEWELALPNTEEVRNRFKNEEIDDILLVITYSGRTPAWPT